MIGVRELNVAYGGRTALEGVGFDLPAGTWALIGGPSGCGKSTLARVLGGLIPHAIPATVEGRIGVAGLDPRRLSIAELAQHVGAVFQNPAAHLFHLRVEDEVAFGPRNLGLSEPEVQRRVDWAIGATNLEDLRSRRPADLSGGQKQCVAVAGALAMLPKVLVLDEPTASLDPTNTARVLTTLRTLCREHGITVVMIEHRLDNALPLADRLLWLEAGRLEADVSASRALRDPALRRVVGLDRDDEAPSIQWGDDTGEGVVAPRALRVTAPAAGDQRVPLVSLDRVHAGYDGRVVVRDVSMDIFPGDSVALVGENGAGKSTVAMVIAGLLRPSAGKVRYWHGHRPVPGLDVGMVFQDPTTQLLTDSVESEVSYGPRNFDHFDPRDHEYCLQALDLVDLRRRRPITLSMGQQQRTAIGAVLALQPRLLILDEPTLGQDRAHLRQLAHFIERSNRDGTAILLVTHDQELMGRCAQRAIELDGGRITRHGRRAPSGPSAAREGFAEDIGRGPGECRPSTAREGDATAP